MKGSCHSKNSKAVLGGASYCANNALVHPVISSKARQERVVLCNMYNGNFSCKEKWTPSLFYLHIDLPLLLPEKIKSFHLISFLNMFLRMSTFMSAFFRHPNDVFVRTMASIWLVTSLMKSCFRCQNKSKNVLHFS